MFIPDTSLKRPFRIATTSFIIPDYMAPNVERLGPYFDEIELLVFESIPDAVLPSEDEIQKLGGLSRKFNLTYNVHLPVDVDLASHEKTERQKAAGQLAKVFKLFSNLPVTTFTLHLKMPKALNQGLADQPENQHPAVLKKWQDQARHGLSLLLPRMIRPEKISVETLDYPFAFVEPVIDELGLSVCMDAGHLIKYNKDLAGVYEKHQSRMPLIHLHGVDFSKQPARDHTALDRLPENWMAAVFNILKSYTGTVSLEVFNFENLSRSLALLFCWFEKIPDVKSLKDER